MTPPTAALPCPFCAKPPEVEECDDGSTWVSCSDSSMKCPAYGNGAELPVWNTRAPAVQATADADEAIPFAWYYKDMGLNEHFTTDKFIGEGWMMRGDAVELFKRKAVSPKAAAETSLDALSRVDFNDAEVIAAIRKASETFIERLSPAQRKRLNQFMPHLEEYYYEAQDR